MYLAIRVFSVTQGFCAKKKPPLRPVRLNTASTNWSGNSRQNHLGAEKLRRFKSVNDLQAIPGIGIRKDKMRTYLTGSATTRVAGPAQPPTAPQLQPLLRLPPAKRKSLKAIDFP